MLWDSKYPENAAQAHTIMVLITCRRLIGLFRLINDRVNIIHEANAIWGHILALYIGKLTRGGAHKGAPTNPDTTPSGFTMYRPKSDWNSPDIAAHWGKVSVNNSMKNPAGPVTSRSLDLRNNNGTNWLMPSANPKARNIKVIKNDVSFVENNNAITAEAMYRYLVRLLLL